MKILIVGIDMYNYTSSLTNAFKALGYDTYEVIMKDNISSVRERTFFKLQQYYFRLLRKDIMPRPTNDVCIKESEKVVNEYERIKPDVVLSFAGYLLTPNALGKMKDSIKILWVYDSIQRLPQIYRTLAFYDLIYTFERSDIAFFKKLGIKADFLPLCVDTNSFFPYSESVKQDIDISFIGSMSPKRIKMLKNIRGYFPNEKLRFYGKYIMSLDVLSKIKRRLNNESNYLTNKPISFQDSLKLYAQSKICLNVLNDQSKDGANMRLFELMACKTFQIVSWNPYIEENFSDCVVTFKDTDELVDKIKYFLERPDERRVFAEHGYNKVTNSERFIDRAKKIIDDIYAKEK